MKIHSLLGGTRCYVDSQKRSFSAHDECRKNMDTIANDYFDEKFNGRHKIDVMLDGGLVNIDRKDRNLTEKFKAPADYQNITISFGNTEWKKSEKE